jgi:hypothetical protein
MCVAFLPAACGDNPSEPDGDASVASPALALRSDLGVDYGLDRAAVDFATRGQLSHPDALRAIETAINPGEFQCPPSTALLDIFLGDFFGWIAAEPEIFELLYVDLLADLIPQIDAMYLQDGSLPQEFGYDGQYTQVMQKTHKDIKRFWDIPSDDILLLAMKGTMLQDSERVSAAYQFFFGVPPGLGDFLASLVLAGLAESVVLDGGNHSLFSFNALAFSPGPGSGIADRIVMGDGVLETYERLGLGDVAPQAIYVHEFAHHVQFENDYLSDPIPTTDPGGADAAEETRYGELMADAMAAYYLTHARGATMNQKRVVQFFEVFFEVGDCLFSNPGHHGTPAQRMRAAQFGFDVADQAHKQGHIMGAQEFHDLFVAEYLNLIAPDAP